MISVSMIVKNEAAHLADALESVRGADEIIVCDTGSTDNTVEIARRFTDKVFTDYVWADNFAEARNHSLAKCSGDWVLIIDADETLEPGGMDKIRELIQVVEQRAVYFDVRAKGGKEHHRAIRLFRREPDIMWKGVAHNYLSENRGHVSQIKIEYGYSEAHKADPDRTLRILKKTIDENPNQPREMFYLAREYWYRSDYQTAINRYSDYLKLAHWGPEIADAQLMLARCYACMRDMNKAREWAMRAALTNANFKEAFMILSKLSGPKNARRWAEIAGSATNEDVLFIR